MTLGLFGVVHFYTLLGHYEMEQLSRDSTHRNLNTAIAFGIHAILWVYFLHNYVVINCSLSHLKQMSQSQRNTSVLCEYLCTVIYIY